MNILIVGCGHIGTKIYEEYIKLKPDRYDIAVDYNEKREDIVYDIAFICVDTPLSSGKCDISQVENAIKENKADLYVIRSTVPPTTTEALVDKTKKNIIYSPEFYGTTQHSDSNYYDFSFMILGGKKEWCDKVVQALQNIYNADYRFIITDSRTAELTKYMENAMLATKVSLCVQFYNIAKDFDISYPELRELVLNDPRINRSHTFVYEDHPYWDSHCFNKDLKALFYFTQAPFIYDVIDYNEYCKRKHEKSTRTWEKFNVEQLTLPVTLTGEMRPATKEEQDSIDNYIKSISTPVQPTIKWIPVNGSDYGVLKCSNCGKYQSRTTNYCSKCGGKYKND